jgi:hypothetical protein
MRELSQNPQAIRLREYRAKKRELTTIGDDTVETEIEIADKPIEKISLKDRLFGGKPAKPSSAKKKGKKIDDSLLKTVAPAISAAFLAAYTRDMLPEKYKLCAPNQTEVIAMIGPYFNILSRSISITGKASETTLDIIASIIASATYGTRCYVTYLKIKEDNNEQPNEHDGNANDGAKSQTREQNCRENITNIGDIKHKGTDVTTDRGNNIGRNEPDTRNDSERVSELLRRDYQGRQQMGLVRRV